MIFLFPALPILAQGTVSVTAEVNRTRITTDDQLTLTVTIEGDYQQFGEPQLPLLAGFNVVHSSRSSQFSMINGVVSGRAVFTYRLQPIRIGNLAIDPFTIVIDGSQYQTQPIAIEVIQGVAPTPSAAPPADQMSSEASQPDATPPSAPEDLTGQDLYVEADVDNDSPYLGQQIIYRFRLYQAINLLNQPRLDWPAFSGFWTESLAPNQVYEWTLGEHRYRVTEVRQALFPTVAGQITIEAATLTIPGGLLSSDIVLETDPVTLDIQPLPIGAPDTFQGVVGQYEMDASIEPREARANEPVTLFLRVWGTGNLSTLPDPSRDADNLLADWRVYDAQVTTEIGQDGDVIQGERRFERLLVPKTAGELHIPAFQLLFFDPLLGEYRSVKTESLAVRVGPGEGASPGTLANSDTRQGIEVRTNDIRHIKTAPPSLVTGDEFVFQNPIYWLGWIVPGLTLAGAWVWNAHRQRLSSDAAYRRSQRAHRFARRRLSQARRLTRNNADAANATVAHALNGYLGDKLNLAPAGLTRDSIRRTLLAKDVSAALVQRSLHCLEWADSGRFAPSDAGRDLEALIVEAEVVITELEEHFKRLPAFFPSQTSCSPLLILLLLSGVGFFLVACGGGVSDAISGSQMSQANQLYEQGRFEDAVDLYEELVKAGAKDGNLYFNLGNTYFKSGDLGRAILYYRRAEHLLPRDGDVAANIQVARANTADQIEGENEGAVVAGVRRLIGWATLDEAAAAALTLWIVLCGLSVGTILLRRRRVLLYLTSITATLLVLSIMSIGVRLLDERRQPPAVIVATETEVRSGPGDDYLTEFALHAGAEVRIIERRGEWVRIALPGELQGWATTDAVIEVRIHD